MKFLDKHLGEIRFFACLNKKPFAEIKIEGESLTVDVIDPVTTVLAFVSHMLRKERFGSKKTIGFQEVRLHRDLKI